MEKNEGRNLPLREGCYWSSDGEIFSVANLHEVEDGFFTFELIESDDPDDLDAIATDLTSQEWPDVSEELGLEFIKK